MKKFDNTKGQERRAELKSLTASLKLAAAMGQIEDGTPNNLLKHYYSAKGHKDLRTFSEWKAAGYSINKGEKSLLLWSSVKEFTAKTIDEDGNEEELKYDSYSYICLFSEKQVHKAS